jgi:hypothetical protein
MYRYCSGLGQSPMHTQYALHALHYTTMVTDIVTILCHPQYALHALMGPLDPS